ncbi:nuclear protein MDM1 isoform X1 [Clarias magur]|uniref:Nuclear protein MDM1 isoform X1 n=1 Tax=Clarias magur TaxID=1594786 RepID=A0A8J4UCU5_CLAMG|nr:nuclear protein MDM1 isoform X1 [Clarias magur]
MTDSSRSLRIKHPPFKCQSLPVPYKVLLEGLKKNTWCSFPGTSRPFLTRRLAGENNHPGMNVAQAVLPTWFTQSLNSAVL